MGWFSGVFGLIISIALFTMGVLMIPHIGLDVRGLVAAGAALIIFATGINSIGKAFAN